MNLKDAIARHLWAREQMQAYIMSGRMDQAAFSACAEANLSALSAIIDVEEPDDAVFLQKLCYLAAYDAAHFRSPPAVWQPHGALLLSVWRRFGWSAHNWPHWEG